MANREYRRARDIAEELGVSVRTVRRWIASGTLPSIKLGGARLVPDYGLDGVLAGDQDA